MPSSTRSIPIRPIWGILAVTAAAVAIMLGCISAVMGYLVDDGEGPYVSMLNQPKNLLNSCRADGFDPWQLACDTCEILLKDPDGLGKHYKRCLECCQEWKNARPHMTEPYRSAIFVFRDHQDGDSEVEQFLRDHWDDVIAKKGAKNLIRMPQDNSYLDAPASKSRKSRYWFMKPPPELVLWYDGPLPTKLKNVQAYRDAATEVIELDGYKKDDIRDMLTAMLADK